MRRVTAMCSGKSLFTMLETVDQYLLMDFLSRGVKVKTIH